MNDKTLHLGTSIHDVTTLEDAYSAQVDNILPIFEEGQLLDTVRKELPEPHIVENILEIYECISGHIFYHDPDPEADEQQIKARIAFPILLDRLIGTPLSLIALYNISRIYEWHLEPIIAGKEVIWGEQEDRRISEQILALFDFNENQKTLAKHLANPHHGYHDEAIDIAVTIHGKDEFDLRFLAIKARPEYFLDKYDYDLRRNKTHAILVRDWAKVYFQNSGINLEKLPQQSLNEKQYKTLSSLTAIFDYHPGIGGEFVRYALACDNSYAKFRAICVLAAWPVNQWPKDSYELLMSAAVGMRGRLKEKYVSAAIEKWQAHNPNENNA